MTKGIKNINMKLYPDKDAELIAFLDDKPISWVFKEALTHYMKTYRGTFTEENLQKTNNFTKVEEKSSDVQVLENDSILGDDSIAKVEVPLPIAVEPVEIATPTMPTPTIATPTIATPTIATPTIATPAMPAPTIATPTIATPTMPAPTGERHSTTSLPNKNTSELFEGFRNKSQKK